MVDDPSVTNRIVWATWTTSLVRMAMHSTSTVRAACARASPSGNYAERRVLPLMTQLQGRLHTPQGAAEGLAREASQLGDTSACALALNAAMGSHRARRAPHRPSDAPQLPGSVGEGRRPVIRPTALPWPNNSVSDIYAVFGWLTGSFTTGTACRCCDLSTNGLSSVLAQSNLWCTRTT